MRAFVTGATGFLGITLVQQLCHDGWDVIAFHRKASDLKDLRELPSVKFAVGDVQDKQSVEAALPENVDAVFHTAASVGFLKPGDDDLQYRTNVLGTQNVVRAALAKRAARFICSSTVLTYDHSSGRRVSEDTPPNANSPFSYISTKHLADLEVERALKRGLDAVFLHPSAVFGAYDKATWSRTFKEMDAGLRVPGLPRGGCSVCHMRQVAKAHVQAFHKGRRGEHYILGGPDVTYREIFQEVGRLLNKPAPQRTFPAWLFRLAGRAEYFASTLMGKEPMLTPSLADMMCLTILCNSEKAIKELGYDPSSLRTMLEDCYQWMRKENMLPERRAERAASTASGDRKEPCSSAGKQHAGVPAQQSS